MGEAFSIGDLSKHAGVKVVTIRYYEQIGILPRCNRTGGNYRVYSPEHVERLQFVRRCRDLGFSLEQVRNLLRLSSIEGSVCTDVCTLAEHHLSEVKQKIADLMRLADELERISTSCSGRQPIDNCRIIAALSSS